MYILLNFSITVRGMGRGRFQLLRASWWCLLVSILCLFHFLFFPLVYSHVFSYHYSLFTSFSAPHTVFGSPLCLPDDSPIHYSSQLTWRQAQHAHAGSFLSWCHIILHGSVGVNRPEPNEQRQVIFGCIYKCSSSFLCSRVAPPDGTVQRVGVSLEPAGVLWASDRMRLHIQL